MPDTPINTDLQELSELLRGEPEKTYRLCKELGLGEKAPAPGIAAAALSRDVALVSRREPALVEFLKRELEAVVPDGQRPDLLFSTMKEEVHGEDRLPVEWVAAVVFDALVKAFLTFCRDDRARRRLEIVSFAASCYVKAVQGVYEGEYVV